MLRRILGVCAGSVIALGGAVGVAQAQTTVGGGTAAAPAALASATSSTPTFNVYDSGFSCGYGAGATTPDSVAYTESYMRGSTSLTSYSLACVGNTGGTTATHTEGRKCADDAAPKKSGFENATFADGEEILVCNVPDVSAKGRTKANKHPFVFADQGFACEATVGTGPNDAKSTNLRNQDSIEFDQSYRAGKRHYTSLITACVGTLPASTTVSSSIVSHEVACTQNSPFDSSAPIGGGFGESITFPDRQYEEICQVPDYQFPTEN